MTRFEIFKLKKSLEQFQNHPLTKMHSIIDQTMAEAIADKTDKHGYDLASKIYKQHFAAKESKKDFVVCIGYLMSLAADNIFDEQENNNERS